MTTKSTEHNVEGFGKLYEIKDDINPQKTSPKRTPRRKKSKNVTTGTAVRVNPRGDWVTGSQHKTFMANVATLLRNNQKFWQLAYDEFSLRHVCRGKLLEDSDIRAITEWCHHNGITAPQRTVGDAVLRVAEGVRFHQVKDYLETLTWDGIPRLDTFLINHAGVPDTPLYREQFKLWMIQAVARIYAPGCQADATLVLEGDQNLGKSTLIRTLFGHQWFTDYMPDLDKADAMLQLRGVWVVELAELATLAHKEAASIKRFLTSRIDRYREPYGRMTVDIPRQCVFVGTVNPGASGYLKDETGGRRFWPMPVTKHIDMSVVVGLRDQLWAEAAHRYHSGENWYLQDRALLTAAAEVQAERYVGDPWTEIVQDILEKSAETEFTVGQILRQIFSESDSRGQWSPGDQVRVGKIMSALGWTRYQKRLAGGKREHRYRCPPQPVNQQSAFQGGSGEATVLPPPRKTARIKKTTSYSTDDNLTKIPEGAEVPWVKEKSDNES